MADSPARILIADSDMIVADSLSEQLSGEGYTVATAATVHEAMSLLREAAHSEQGPFQALVADADASPTTGPDLLRQVRKHHPMVAVILTTAFGSVESAVEAMRLGACDYLVKPIAPRHIKEAIAKALRQYSLLCDTHAMRSRHRTGTGLDRMVGQDRRMLRVYEVVEAVAPTRTTVLLTGESGTGKSMIVRCLHELSPRVSGPLVTFACGAIPETLLESELFGHIKGAFTGADTDKPGKIRAAEGGTLFIDEINSATPALQLKLLRVLQEKVYEPVGSHKTQSADVRFVLASNEPLDKLVEVGRFRQDLYYRINVITVDLPPLRGRDGDIVAMAEHFLNKYCDETGKVITSIEEEAIEALVRYRWPGNVRELENAIERAVVLARRPVIRVDDLPDVIRFQNPNGEPGFRERRRNGWSLPTDWTPQPLKKALGAPEQQILLAALRYNDWNRQQTAACLEIDRTTLYKKIKQYKLDEVSEP